MITEGQARNPSIVETLQQKGSKLTCSYLEEKRAMSLAISWLQKNSQVGRAAICTDSLSLLEAINNESLDTQQLREELKLLNADILLKWVPGHADIPGNEIVDKQAKLATKLPTDDSEACGNPVTFGAAKSCIRQEIKDADISHQRTASVYSIQGCVLK